MDRKLKIIVERHSDGYVSYPIGLKGVIVGEGDTYEDALADVKSAIAFHIETFGVEVLERLDFQFMRDGDHNTLLLAELDDIITRQQKDLTDHRFASKSDWLIHL